MNAKEEMPIFGKEIRLHDYQVLFWLWKSLILKFDLICALASAAQLVGTSSLGPGGSRFNFHLGCIWEANQLMFLSLSLFFYFSKSKEKMASGEDKKIFFLPHLFIHYFFEDFAQPISQMCLYLSFGFSSLLSNWFLKKFVPSLYIVVFVVPYLLNQIPFFGKLKTMVNQFPLFIISSLKCPSS